MNTFLFEDIVNNNVKFDNFEMFKININNSIVEVIIDNNDITLDFDRYNINNIKLIYEFFKSKKYNIDGVFFKVMDNVKHLRYYDLDYDFLDKLFSETNINIKISKEEVINYSQYKTFAKNIKIYKEKIKNSDMSPVEKLLFAYDILKTFKYKETTSNDLSNSRVSYKVFNTGEIVCAGYTAILNEILSDMDDNLNVSDFFVRCLDKDNKWVESHSRSMVRIDDEKYNIHGIFALDVTWDSMNDYNEYKYFLIPFSEYKEYFPKNTLPHLFIRNMHTLNEEFDLNKIYEEINSSTIESDEIFDKYIEKGIFNGVKTQKEKLSYFLTSRISLDMLINIVKNVRLNEGYTLENVYDNLAEVLKENTENYNYNYVNGRRM